MTEILFRKNSSIHTYIHTYRHIYARRCSCQGHPLLTLSWRKSTRRRHGENCSEDGCRRVVVTLPSFKNPCRPGWRIFSRAASSVLKRTDHNGLFPEPITLLLHDDSKLLSGFTWPINGNPDNNINHSVLSDPFGCHWKGVLFVNLLFFYWKIKVGIWDHRVVCVSTRMNPLPHQLLNAWTNL
jgi:hypothetical protein